MKTIKAQTFIFFMFAFVSMIAALFLGGNVSAHEDSIADQKSTMKTESSLTKDIAKPEVRALPAFNWRLLDTDGIDLSTFEKVSVNTPAKLTGGAFSRTQRDYYMFFGHVGKGHMYNQTNGTFEPLTSLLGALGDTKQLALTGPGMIGVKKGTTGRQQIFGYDYSYSTLDQGGSNSNFEIGELNAAGQVIKSGEKYTYIGRPSVANEYILEQYVKDNEIVSYGYFRLAKNSSVSSTATSTYLPIRVHGYVADFKRGRIRYDVSLYNENTQETSYAINHASHMDVGGNHTNSRLFSYGNGGIYFNEPTATRADGIPARVFFYTNIGYPDSSNKPIEYLPGTLDSGPGTAVADKIGFFNSMSTAGFDEAPGSAKEPFKPWSNNYLPMHSEYVSSHPIFIMRWPKTTVPGNGVGSVTLDMSIEEPELMKPVVEKSYKNTTSTNGDNMIGDVLDFEVTASNDGDVNPWQQVTLEDKLPPELELDTSSLVMVDVAGIESALPASIYDPGTHSFSIGKYDIGPKKSITIKYKAKIIGGSQTEIINKFKGYNDKNDEDEVELAIPVKGEPAKPQATKNYTNETSADGKDRVEDILTFELTASNAGEAIWKEVMWKDQYPAELEVDKMSFVLVDDKGIEQQVTPIFNAPQSFMMITPSLDVPGGKQITLRYKAKIISGEGTTITNKFTAYTSFDVTKKADAEVSISVLPKKPLTREFTIHFVDKTGKKIAEPIIRTETIGSFIKLKDEADTIDSELYKAIEAVKAQQYNLVERPTNEASVEIIDGVNEVTYVFDGKLMLYSAPNVINFSTHKYDGKTTRVNTPIYDQDLVVKDGRSAKEKWTLTAKLTSEMTHIDPANKNSILKNAIRYVYEGKEIILDKEAKPIMRHTNDADKELYNISSTWNGTKAGDGFKLEVDPGDVKKLGSYQGEILWELAATPDP